MPKHSQSPKVSVIITTYNYGAFIADAIKSVLEQSFQDFEIIVVDDGSTDQTRQVLEPFVKQHQNRIRYFFQDNQGAASGRNKGIKEAKGEYIAFLDADDTFLPLKLEKQMKIIQASDVGLVHCLRITKDIRDNAPDVIRPTIPSLQAHAIWDLATMQASGHRSLRNHQKVCPPTG